MPGEAWKEWIRKLIAATCEIAPHPGTMSRWRLLIDGAPMLWPRVQHAAAIAEGRSHARYFMADASEQHGHSFEHVVVRSIDRSVLMEG